MPPPRARVEAARSLRGWRCLLLGGLLAGSAARACATGPPETAPPPARLGSPTDAPSAPCRPTPLNPAAFQDGRALPIDLATALRLAETANLDVAQAREVVTRARTVLARARIQLLPNFNLGSTYADHEGGIQRTEGNVVTVNRDSLFVGGGPSLAVSFAEALFAPLVARQLFVSSRAGLQRVTNDTLFTVASAYFNVLRARRRLARADETLDYLASERPSAARANSRGLLPLVKAFYEAGGREALRAEVERVRVEVFRRQEEQTAALQEFQVAVSELARLLQLDPALMLWPVEDFRFPVPLPGADYAQRPLEELVALALNNRPELAENQALVQAAVERVRTARFRPLLPNLVLNYNWGGFGGGPDTNPPIIQRNPLRITSQPGFGPSGRIRHFQTRSDFDVTLLWRLQNAGLGNWLEVRELESVVRQSNLRQVQLRDLVVAQVVQAYDLELGWAERVRTIRAALFDDKGAADGPVFRSLRLNFQRIREVEGTRPLEVLDSIRGLNDTLEAYAQALSEWERAHFRLLVALGLPPRDLIGPLEQAGRPEGLSPQGASCPPNR